MPAQPLQPVKVLVLTSNFPRWQGDFAGVFLVRLLAGLPKHGILPIVLAPHAKGAAEHEIIEGIEVIRFRYAADDDETIAYSGAMQQQLMSLGGMVKFRNFLESWKNAADELIASRQIQLIAGHWLIPTGIVMSRLSRDHSIPMILSSHGTDLRLGVKFRWLVPRMMSALWSRLDSWTVVSHYLAALARKIQPRLSDRVEVLPLPMNDELFSPDPAISRDPQLVVCVTKFTLQKRVDQFIQAIRIACERIPEIHAEIYGAGPERARLTKQIAALKLESAIQLCEPVAQAKLAEIYRRAGMVVLNSVDEGFGAVLVEAMLCGTPVIGTDSGGIPDIILHEETGLLVPADDPAQLAASMIRLVNDQTLAANLGTAGLMRARETFSSDVLIRRYAEIIHAAIAHPR